ncbi:MAG: metallophosphoesterase [Oligoflexia bacterium]|nr:metallophosphoesterase [Oligoflexia bacterium]
MKKIFISIFSFIFLVTLSFFSTITNNNAIAAIIQILHTNDIHSHFDSSDGNIGTDGTIGSGGIKNLKIKIDQLTKEAKDKNISTLFLDAGDFSEGDLYYLSERGATSFKILNQLGINCTVIGNHDTHMGIDRMEEIFAKEVVPNFPILATNLYIPEEYVNIKKVIKPYLELNVGGVKIAIVAPTTDERMFSWIFNPAVIEKPIKSVQEYIPYLRDRNDVIIALSHLGTKVDKKLALKVPEIDLIIGGHTHTTLKEPLYVTVKDPDIKGAKKEIPIFHAGAFVESIGKLIIDVTTDKYEKTYVKVLSYELIANTNSTSSTTSTTNTTNSSPAINNITTILNEAKTSLSSKYPYGPLDEIIGHNSVILKKDSLEENSPLDLFMADSMLDAAEGDLAIHISWAATEIWRKTGNITRADLFNFFPRVMGMYEDADGKIKISGGNLYRARVKGGYIRSLVQLFVQFHQTYPVYFSGITFKLRNAVLGSKVHPYDIRVDGRRVLLGRYYDVILPELYIRAGFAMSDIFKVILKDPEDTGINIWQAMEAKLKRDKVIK